ncbi:5-hydroxytryptamine receptor 1B-like [Paramacrobiotus metropolitanus]|uniref:5-hydroxytryptamine receptor 1B-like n=1 Tax=Paramacrobiotus metropolitanus TaxID=2943436 RepID=UPI0024460C1B|nr:5-hydroxytryptamine receptor 1B-like [Paramacrobiotus metropolitanus]
MNIPGYAHFIQNVTNLTAHHGNRLPLQNTKFMGYIYMMLTIFSYFSNTFLLFVYYRCPSLHTPFSIYVVSLSISDLCKSLTNGIMKTTNNLQLPWFLGDPYCLLCMFSARTVTAIMRYIQVLISFNRFWAVTFPHSYRTHHNKKFAVGLVIGAILFVNVWALPGFITQDLHNRTGTERKFCLVPFEKQTSVYYYFYGVIINLVPQALIIMMYPFIYYKVKKVLRNKKKIGAAPTPSNSGEPSSKPSKPSKASCLSVPRKNAQQTYQMSRAAPSSAAISEFEMEERPRLPTPPASKELAKKAPVHSFGTRHFAVLTALLISATLMWTPVHLAYTLMMSGTFVDFRYLGVANLLFALDCTLNPLLCLLSSKEWRNAARTLFRH